MVKQWPTPLEVRHQIAYSDAVASMATPGGTYSAEASQFFRDMASRDFSYKQEFSAIERDAYSPFEQALRAMAHRLYEQNPQRLRVTDKKDSPAE